MIGCLRICVRKQPIIALYFESENVLKFYSLETQKTGFHMSNNVLVAMLFQLTLGADLFTSKLAINRYYKQKNMKHLGTVPDRDE